MEAYEFNEQNRIIWYHWWRGEIP